MAIQFDGVSSGNGNPVNNLTFSHTCSGNNRILLVYAWVEDGADLVTGMTYNSVSLTRIATVQHTDGLKRSYLYYLLNPSTGSNTISIAMSSSDNIHSVATSYTGVRQGSQPDSSNTASQASGASFTLSTTVLSSGCWLVSGVGDPNGSVASTGTTERISGAGVANIGDSNGIVGSGSKSMVWTPGNSGTETAGIIVSLKPVIKGAALIAAMI